MDLIPGLPAEIGLECLVRIPHHHFSSVASVCKSWKLQLELPEFWRHRKASGLTRKVIALAQASLDPTREPGTKKYTTSPVYRLTLCEPETGLWTELPPLPGQSDGLLMFCQLAGVGPKLVVMGGWDPATFEVSRAVFVYDLVSATWRCGADMPGPQRSFFACASDSDGTVFVAGGHDGEKCALMSAMAYDVARDEWTVMPDMARERDEAKGLYCRGAFHVIGGYRTSMQGGFETSAESFDVATWRWGPVREDFLDRAMCPRNCAVSDDGGKFLVCRGGDVAVLGGSAWRVVAELACDVRNTACVTAWQDMLVIGSERFGAPYKAFILDLKSCKWETVEAGEEFSGHVQSGCCLEL